MVIGKTKLVVLVSKLPTAWQRMYFSVSPAPEIGTVIRCNRLSLVDRYLVQSLNSPVSKWFPRQVALISVETIISMLSTPFGCGPLPET